ncbi:MAG TPA: hypothetical protein VN655_03475 [Pseudolabrys sp.]|jgi:hypothetical protein|nr:hypothetical protein [Pseudolabrys sp.]
MAKKRKAAKAGRRKAAVKGRRKAVRRAAARKSARKPARKAARKPKAKPEGIGARLAHAVDAVLGTLSDAERLHAQTARAKGFQELE